jgi:predicted O-methyltransferase YrrM
MAQHTYERGRLSHEKDERWDAVDKFALRHLLPTESRLYERISFAQQVAERNRLPEIEVSSLQGKHLMTQIQAMDAKNVLEVGTLGGISSQ